MTRLTCLIVALAAMPLFATSAHAASLQGHVGTVFTLTNDDSGEHVTGGTFELAIDARFGAFSAGFWGRTFVNRPDEGFEWELRLGHEASFAGGGVLKTGYAVNYLGHSDAERQSLSMDLSLPLTTGVTALAEAEYLPMAHTGSAGLGLEYRPGGAWTLSAVAGHSDELGSPYARVVAHHDVEPGVAVVLTGESDRLHGNRVTLELEFMRLFPLSRMR
jgi:hypothetical protein